MSYANLIAEAIIKSPEKALVLSDIYEAINAKYPYYDLESQGWQNSIRHNLSLNKNFTKEKKDKTGLKRGWYWKLSEGHSFFAPKKKAFQCDECTKAFSSIGGLNYHKNIGHEENFGEKASNSKKRTIGGNDINLKVPSKKRKDNSNFEPNEDIGYGKPNLSFAQLIAEALNNAPEQSLALSDIYKAINAKHPYYELETRGWQNSIRHNLTMNENFIREQQVPNYGKRGCYWKLSKDVPISLLETKKKLRRKKRSAKAIQGNLLKGIDNFVGATPLDNKF